MDLNLVKLIIRGISYSQTQVGAYALILEEVGGDRKLPIIIGNFEAQAIAIGLERDLKPPRPLTHDLFIKLAEKLSIFIKSVVIYKLKEGVFYSNIIFEELDGNIFEIDARTSDAIALAIRFDAPVYAMQHVMEKAGISMQIITKEDEENVQNTIDKIKEEIKSVPITKEEKTTWENYSYTQLKEMMEEAVANENYELAAQLRDEIEKRKNN